MLSRVAERVYWMCRYLERAENASRLVVAYGELVLDLPAEAQLGWSVALQILGLDESYQNVGGGEGELPFLLNSERHQASLLSTLKFARENARTTRDVVPSEVWRAVNELYMFAQQELPGVANRPSSQVPSEVVDRCHEITGMLEGTMSHGPAYQFVRLGRSLERADMSSRIIDVAAATMLTGRDELKHYDNAIWRAVLRAMSAYQMYRQYVRRRITGPDVVNFLLLNPDFPRSVIYSVDALDRAARKLPRSEAARRDVASLRANLAPVKLESINHAFVHQLADDIQLELATLHNTIFETWLNPMRVA